MTDNSTGNRDTRRAAERYIRAGLAPIPIPTGEKNPNRPGWQNERHSVEDIPKLWTNGQNIGLILGEPSGWLVDVDLDCPETRKIAGRFLEPTRTSGRDSEPDSHWWYRCQGLRSEDFRDLDGEKILEIRSTGRQTVVAPSLHPSGERYSWSESGLEEATVEAEYLLRSCRELATAGLIARCLPRGGRHDFGLALAGFLLRRDLEPEAVERIMHAAWDAAGFDSERARREAHADIEGIVRDTAEGLEAGSEVSGGGVLEELRPGLPRRISRCWRWRAEGTTQEAPRKDAGSIAGDFARTDLGNAERLVARHGGDLRYVHKWKCWLVWDGKRWKIDTSGEVERRAVETVRSIYGEAEKHPDTDVSKALGRHAITSESRSRIEAMIALARSRPGIPVEPEKLDASLDLLNVENGTLDLLCGDLSDHRRENLLTKLAPVEYDPEAQAPTFLRFLGEIFDGDEELISFVRRFAGYTLTGSTEERVFAILHGRGKNGKSTLVELLRDAMGEYARNTDIETVLQKDYRGVGNDVAALCGARLVSAAEVEQGRHLAESRVKNLTGSDTVTARFLFSEPFDFKPQFKLWLSTNNKPTVRGTDDAIWDRIRLIPFGQRFDGERQDPKLPEKLREELPGVLAWMVRGCLEWRREGLGEAETVRRATEHYRTEMDAISLFVEDRCVVSPSASVGATPLWKAWESWCTENGEDKLTRTMFGRRIGERFHKQTKQTVTYYGIGLRSDEPDPDGSDRPLEGRREFGGSEDGARGFLSNPLGRESPIPTRDSEDSSRELESSGGFSENLGPIDSLGERLSENYLKPSNSLKPSTEEPSVTLRESRPLSAEDVQEYRRLMREGMSPDMARSEILGEEIEP